MRPYGIFGDVSFVYVLICTADIVHRREILPPENNSHATGLTSLPSYGPPIQIGELEFPNSSTINGLGTNTVLRQSDHGLGVHFPQFLSDSHYFDQAGLSSSSRSPVESGDANSEYRATDFPRGPSHLSTYPLEPTSRTQQMAINPFSPWDPQNAPWPRNPQLLPHNHRFAPPSLACSSRTPVESRYPPCEYRSTNVESSSRESLHDPVASHSGPHPVVNDSVFPWNGPSDLPATSINGGIFIGNVESNGEAGKL
jgi:hypothetical protein